MFGRIRVGLAVAAAAVAIAGTVPGQSQAASLGPEPPNRQWSFEGIFGTYDRAAAQRGLQVYQQVCAACHGMRHLAYRHLEGIGFSPEEVEVIAQAYRVTEIGDDGQPVVRPARASDFFVEPYENSQAAAAANNGKVPPDLSLMAKARDGGADYTFAFLTGYLDEAPDGQELPLGQYWNEYYPGHLVAMPNMLVEDGIQYDDGTEASVEQQALDVTHFLMWAAEPHMEARKELGVRVVLFLIVFAGLMYAVKRKVWADAHHAEPNKTAAAE